jgi:hypothetical protein
LVEERAAPDDARVLELRDAFDRVTGALPGAQRAGWEDAASPRERGEARRE